MTDRTDVPGWPRVVAVVRTGRLVSPRPGPPGRAQLPAPPRGLGCHATRIFNTGTRRRFDVVRLVAHARAGLEGANRFGRCSCRSRVPAAGDACRRFAGGLSAALAPFAGIHPPPMAIPPAPTMQAGGTVAAPRVPPSPAAPLRPVP